VDEVRVLSTPSALVQSFWKSPVYRICASRHKTQFNDCFSQSRDMPFTKDCRDCAIENNKLVSQNIDHTA
jgi:hypothetical protein